MNSVPYEVLMGCPFSIYEAVVGATYPKVDETPTGDWTKVGSNLNFSEDGLTFDHPQTITKYRSAGDCGTRKVDRTEEDLIIKAVLNDLRAQAYALALNGNSVTPTPAGPGVAGVDTVGLSRGFGVKTVALLIRADFSPEMEMGAMQYEVPIAAQTGSSTVAFKKGAAAGLSLEWTALVDPDATSDDERFGRLVIQTDVAES